MQDLVSESNRSVFLLTGSRLDTLEPYFSHHEYGRLKWVALVPFLQRDRLLGLLLIVSAPCLEESIGVLDVAFSAITRPAGAVLAANRDSHLHGARNQAILDEGELHTIAAETPAPPNGNTAIVTFSIESLVDRIGGGAGDIDRFRVRQDVLHVIAAMVAETVTMGTDSSGRVILLFADDTRIDPELALHQISFRMDDLFAELDTPPDLRAEIRRVDHARERVEEVLTEQL
ncbi:MAG: hypothetical protein ACLFRR_06805 [Spirochaetaceae bacterium]